MSRAKRKCDFTRAKSSVFSDSSLHRDSLSLTIPSYCLRISKYLYLSICNLVVYTEKSSQNPLRRELAYQIESTCLSFSNLSAVNNKALISSEAWGWSSVYWKISTRDWYACLTSRNGLYFFRSCGSSKETISSTSRHTWDVVHSSIHSQWWRALLRSEFFRFKRFYPQIYNCNNPINTYYSWRNRKCNGASYRHFRG